MTILLFLKSFLLNLLPDLFKELIITFFIDIFCYIKNFIIGLIKKNIFVY